MKSSLGKLLFVSCPWSVVRCSLLVRAAAIDAGVSSGPFLALRCAGLTRYNSDRIGRSLPVQSTAVAYAHQACVSRVDPRTSTRPCGRP